MKTYPRWVEKHHTKGTSVKEIGNNYYLYSVTSKYSKEKGYPVSIQRYIGKITKEGLVEPNKISFIPGKDKIVLLKDLFSLKNCTKDDLKLIKNIPVVSIGGYYYTGLLTNKIEKLLNKYFVYEEGVIHEELQ